RSARLTYVSVSRGRSRIFRAPYFSAIKRAMEPPAGKSRSPARSAESTADHVSPCDPGIAPEFRVGHLPVVSFQRVAQSRISLIVSGRLRCACIGQVGRKTWPTIIYHTVRPERDCVGDVTA